MSDTLLLLSLCCQIITKDAGLIFLEKAAKKYEQGPKGASAAAAASKAAKSTNLLGLLSLGSSAYNLHNAVRDLYNQEPTEAADHFRKYPKLLDELSGKYEKSLVNKSRGVTSPARAEVQLVNTRAEDVRRGSPVWHVTHNSSDWTLITVWSFRQQVAGCKPIHAWPASDQIANCSAGRSTAVAS
ncbi:hypothetical protein ACOMHN_006551 [Nucella lapillus]